MEKNPFAVNGERPKIEMDNDGEWNYEEQKLYDDWDRENEEEDNHGTCKEKGCLNDAAIDYNDHGHWVCQKHYDSLNEDFDKEYN